MPSATPSPRRASSANKKGTSLRRQGDSSAKKSSDRQMRASGRSSGASRVSSDDDGRRRSPRAGEGTPRAPRARADFNPKKRSPRDPREEREERDSRPARPASGARRTKPGERGARTGEGPSPRRTRDGGPYEQKRSTRNDAPSSRRPDTRDGAPRRSRDSDARNDRSGPTRRPGAPRPARGAGAGASANRYARAPRSLSPEELEHQKITSHGRDKGWGGVARKGATHIKSTGGAMEETPSAGRTPDPLGDWVEEVRPGRPAPVAKAKPKVHYALPGDVASDVRKAFIGTAYMREKTVATLTRAAEAYDRKRYDEALRLGRTVADAVPGVAPVRELTGLAAYRAERWSMAKIHLRAYFAITGDPEHLPLVMDCDRANHRYRAVEKTFAELEASEPTAEVLVEGRIVMAATWADQQHYDEAIALLTKAGATKQLRNPSYRHVRLWYALADVFDRAGDAVAARELFARVVIAEPDAYDAQARLAELGSGAPSKNRKRRKPSVSKKNVD